MLRNEIASFSLMKIICISFVMIFCSTIGVMAFHMQIDETVKMVPVSYEDIVSEETSEEIQENEITKENILSRYKVITEKIETVIEVIPFETVTKEVSGGTTDKVIQQGKDGERTVIYIVRYIGETEVSREEISSEITKAPVDKIIEKRIVTSRSSDTARTENTTSTGEYIKFTATGYCPCVKCCGKATGITASGAKAQAGTTVAMSSKYSFGTAVEIKGMGTYTVQDRGGAVTGNKVDIFFNTHQEALNFGRRTVELQVK